MRFNCDSCKQRYEADDSFAGEDVECSKCGATISVPELEPTPELTIKAVQPPKTAAEPKAPKLSISSSAGQKPAEQKTEEAQEKKKTPNLSMPASSPKNTEEKDAEKTSEDAAGNCPNCGAALQSATAVICTNCGHNLKLGMNVNTLKKAKTAGKLGLAIGAGAGAAVLSGVIWAAIAVWLKLEIGYIACLVGLITGAVVCLVTPERSARMGALAVGLAVVGMLCGKMLTAEYLIRDTFKSFNSMAEKFSEFNKKMGQQFKDEALMGILTEEMQENGEIPDPYNSKESSKATRKDWKKIGEQYKQNQAKVKKKFATLSAEDKARLQKKVDRAILIYPLMQEMIANGEIPKADDKLKELAPKSFKDKPSKEYLEAVKKSTMQYMENLKKVRKKLYSLSDEEAKRLKDNMGSSISNQISYWEKLKMVTSYWDILWFLLAISTAWGLGNGTSSLSRQGL